MPPDSPPDAPHRLAALFVILLIALALRLGWALSRPVSEASLDALPDQREYLAISRNFLHGRGLQFLDDRFADTVWAFRTPGYPLLIAACGGNVRAVRTVQAILDSSTVLAIFLLARALAPLVNRRLHLLAAAVVAINPYLIYFTGLILSETLFTAMLAWGMFLLAYARNKTWLIGNLIWWCGGGVLAMSVLVRPSALGLPVGLGLCAALQAGRMRPATAFPVGARTVALTLLVLLPWAIRNEEILGQWVWLDTNSGFTIYDGYNPDATGASDQSFVEREPELQNLNELGRSAYLEQKGLRYARTHPARALQLAGSKLVRTWSALPLSRQFGRPLYRWIALIYSLPLDVLIILGLLRGDLARSAKVLLLAPAIYFSIVHALSVGSLRYRVPAEPPIAIIAASAFAALFHPSRPTA